MATLLRLALKSWLHFIGFRKSGVVDISFRSVPHFENWVDYHRSCSLSWNDIAINFSVILNYIYPYHKLLEIVHATYIRILLISRNSWLCILQKTGVHLPGLQLGRDKIQNILKKKKVSRIEIGIVRFRDISNFETYFFPTFRPVCIFINKFELFFFFEQFRSYYFINFSEPKKSFTYYLIPRRLKYICKNCTHHLTYRNITDGLDRFYTIHSLFGLSNIFNA